MPRWLNVLIQGLAIAGTAFASFGGLLPVAIGAKIYVAISAAQAAVSVIAHSFNPDGTPATTPYRPPE